jgi:hypothetical protein
MLTPKKLCTILFTFWIACYFTTADAHGIFSLSAVKRAFFKQENYSTQANLAGAKDARFLVVIVGVLAACVGIGVGIWQVYDYIKMRQMNRIPINSQKDQPNQKPDSTLAANADSLRIMTFSSVDTLAATEDSAVAAVMQ